MTMMIDYQKTHFTQFTLKKKREENFLKPDAQDK